VAFKNLSSAHHRSASVRHRTAADGDGGRERPPLLLRTMQLVVSGLRQPRRGSGRKWHPDRRRGRPRAFRHFWKRPVPHARRASADRRKLRRCGANPR